MAGSEGDRFTPPFGFVLEDAQRHLNSGLLLAQFIRVSLKQTESQQTKLALAA
jgi:hypothetical protein